MFQLSAQDKNKVRNWNMVLKEQIPLYWNKYQSKVTIQEWHLYLDYLIDPSFQEVTRLFVLSFENNNGRASYKRYYLPQAEIKDYNVMIDGRNFFDQPVKSNSRAYDNIQKIANGQGDDYTTGLLHYHYFKTYYKMITVDLSNSKSLMLIQKYNTIQQINFTGNVFRYLKRKRNNFRFYTRNC